MPTTMKKYELMTIININQGEDGAIKVSNSVKDLIFENGGTILNSDFWGKRNFAYEINHQNAGFYDVISFEISAEGLMKLESKLKFLDSIVRYLITAQS